MFLKPFLGFCHFLMQSNQRHTFPFQPFTSDFASFMSIISKTTICLVIQKLDGVGPVDNRPSIDKPHHYVRKKREKKMRHMTCDT